MTYPRFVSPWHGWFAVDGQSPSPWFHCTVATLFVGPAVEQVVIFQRGISDQSTVLVGIIFAIAALMSFGLLLKSGLGERITVPFAFLLFLMTSSGLPGILMYQSDRLLAAFAFAGGIAVRNLVCFLMLPASKDGLRGRPERVFLFWALIGSMVIVVSSFLLGVQSGIGLNSEAQLGRNLDLDWMNANYTGMFCSFACTLLLAARFIPVVVRLPMAALCLYTLILTHSRTSIIVLVASAITWRLITAGRKFVAIAAMAVTLPLVQLVLGDVDLSSIPAVSAVLGKFEKADFRTNSDETTRFDVLRRGLDTWVRSPVFGFGFAHPDARMENAYFSIACEQGVIGLAAYLLIVATVLAKALRMLKSPPSSRSFEAGLLLACITLFILLHGLGEDTHGFTFGSPIGNLWALIAALSNANAVGIRRRGYARPFAVYHRLGGRPLALGQRT
jgi:hypothetical protein